MLKEEFETSKTFANESEDCCRHGRCPGLICCHHGRCCNDSRYVKSVSSACSSSCMTSDEDDDEDTSVEENDDDYEKSTSFASADGDLSVVPVPNSYLKVTKIPENAKKVDTTLSLCSVLQGLGYGYPKMVKEVSRELTEDLPSILTEPKDKRLAHRQDLFSRYFIGCLTRVEAENLVDGRTSFRVYYMLYKTPMELGKDIDADYDNYLTEALPLFIVYRRDDGCYNHYKIDSTHETDGTPLYFVQYGDPKPPIFRSIERLLNFYHNTTAARTTRHGIIKSVDIFPYWKNKADTSLEF